MPDKKELEKIAAEINKIKTAIRDPKPDPRSDYNFIVEDNFGKASKMTKVRSLKEAEKLIDAMDDALAKWEDLEGGFFYDEESEQLHWKNRTKAERSKKIDPRNWYSLLTGGYDTIVIEDEKSGDRWMWAGQWDFIR